MVPSVMRDSLTAATERYAAALPGSPVETYLTSRGVGPEVAATAKLGMCDGSEPGHENMAGMLSLPYLSRGGVVGFKFRNLRPDAEPKYLNPAGQKLRLFNVNAFHEAGSFIAVCEGEIDAITLHYLCAIPAVSVPGAKAWNRRVHARCFEGFQRVWVMADNDVREDGSNPGMELGMKIRDDVPQAVIVRLPPNRDVNNVYLDEGRDYLRSLIGLSS